MTQTDYMRQEKEKEDTQTLKIAWIHQYKDSSFGGARDVMVIVVGNGHSDSSSNPGRGLIAFPIALIPLGKVRIQLFSLQLWVNSRTD